MINSKSKRVGLIGTLFFHLGIVLICLFSSIGYTSIDEPIGIEIEFLPYNDSHLMEDIISSKSSSTLIESNIITDNKVENLIIEETESIKMPEEEDTLTLSDTEMNVNNTISLELEKALSRLNAQKNSQEEKDTLRPINDQDVQQESVNSSIDITQDGYVLSDNRFAVRKIKPKYACEEFGKVVVRVWVNREGKTIKAEAGIRGTTESSSCLLREARSAALQTTWTPYFDAPEVQIGQITYNFYKY